MDKIFNCVDNHDESVVQKIQKRRGRKRFILSTEEQINQDEANQFSLNKREAKYLSKVCKMAELPIKGIDSSQS